MKDTATISAVDPEKDGKKTPDEWQIKDWARTITDAEDIKRDPKKMKHVQKHLKKQHAAIGMVLTSTDDLRKKAKEMDAGEPDADD